MNKQTLAEDNIFSPALDKIGHFHEETLAEVMSTVSENKIVVVGMRLNPFVRKAKKLLESKDLDFKYLEYGGYMNDWKKRLAIKLWSGWPSYPQVFIDGKLVGGYSELESHLKQS